MASNNGWNGFVNIPLDAQHRKAIKALAKKTKPEDVFQQVMEIVTDGYKLTISDDANNDCFVVTLVGKGDHVNSGFAMSQRHSDLHVAMVAVLFAHVEIAQRGDWSGSGAVQQAFDW